MVLSLPPRLVFPGESVWQCQNVQAENTAAKFVIAKK
jgi:hypothetical protein